MNPSARHHERRGARRGFALLIVLLLGFVAGIALSILLLRSAAAARAAQSQVDGYRLHHVQAGLRHVAEVWAQMFRRVPERDTADAVIGFDLVLDDGTTLEVRFKDMQGALREDTTDLPEDANSVLEAAARVIVQEGKATAKTIRRRGPGRVSLHTAEADVLTAIASAVSADANAAAFASAVTDKRATGRIEAKDVPILVTAAGLPPDDAALLQNCVTTEPQLWFVTATLRSEVSGVTERQGGLVLGAIRTIAPAAGAMDAGTNPAAAATSVATGGPGGQSVNWTVLTWTKLPLRGDTDDREGWPEGGL